MINISLATDPRYGPMLNALNDLKQRHRDAIAELQKLAAAISRKRAETVPVGVELTINADGTSPDTGEAMETLRDRFTIAHAETERLQGAITLQEKLLNAEHTAASSRACATVLPEYAAVVKRLAYAALDLQHAIAAEREFRQAIESRGIAVVAPLRLPGVDVSTFGAPGSPTKLNAMTERANDAARTMIALLPAQPGLEPEKSIPVEARRVPARRLASGK